MYSLQEMFTLHVFITRVVYKVVYPDIDPTRAHHMDKANNKDRLNSQENISWLVPYSDQRGQLNLDKAAYPSSPLPELTESQVCSHEQVNHV